MTIRNGPQSTPATTATPWESGAAAQALLENCALVSVDKVFDGTAVDRRW